MRSDARKRLAALLRQLHAMGVESANVSCSVCKGRSYILPCLRCDGDGYDHVSNETLLQILGEKMGVDTPGITMGDVLTAAKAAGVY